MKDVTKILEWKQKIKGIFDSPCVDVCNFKNKEKRCQTCGLLHLEKKTWRYYSDLEKKKIIKSCNERLIFQILP